MKRSNKNRPPWRRAAAWALSLGILAAAALMATSVQRVRASDAGLDTALAALDGSDTCEGVGYVVLGKNGKPVRWILRCRGQCIDATGVPVPCRIQRSVNHHGGIREWCGCEGVGEPQTCHLVKVTPGPGEGGGKPFFVCAGPCPPDPATGLQQVCLPVEETIMVGGRTVIRVHCECFPDDLVEPRD